MADLLVAAEADHEINSMARSARKGNVMSDLSLKTLSALARGLNEASDTLSKQLARFEGTLNELKLGVSAWVTIAKYETSNELRVGGKPETVTKVGLLGYGKHQGKWCLLFGTSLEEYPDPEFETEVPLRDAPRLERIAAVDKLPALVQALESKAREVAQLATAKASQVADLVTALNKTAA